MLPALLAQIGLPLLVKAVSGALSTLDHPAAKTAAAALDAVSLTAEQTIEANRHIERLAELDSAEARTALEQINATFRTEVATDDPYVRRWRPTFGYAVAFTWAVTMASVSWAVVADPTQAPAIIAALVNTSPIWAVALGVLGVSVVKRSQDKALGR